MILFSRISINKHLINAETLFFNISHVKTLGRIKTIEIIFQDQHILITLRSKEIFRRFFSRSLSPSLNWGRTETL